MRLADCTEQQMIFALKVNDTSEEIINAALAQQTNTLATTANTTATQVQTLSEEEWLAQQWLSIGAEEADTVATTENTVAKKANLSVTNLLRVACSKLFAVLAANPVVAITAVALGALLAIKKYYDHVEKVRQQLKETAKEAKSAIDEINSSFKTLSSTTNDIKKRYAELAQGVENLGKVNQSRGSLSNDDYEEFLDLSNQLAKLFPQLTVGYDDNGNAILNLSGNVNTIVGSLNNLVDVQQKLANQEILGKLSDVWAGYTIELEEYNKKLQDSQESLKKYQKLMTEVGSDSEIKIRAGESELMWAAQKAGIYKPKDIWDSGPFVAHYTEAPHNGGRYIDSYTLDLQKLTEEEKKALLNALGELSSEYNKAVQMAKGNITSANADMSSYINTWLSGEWNYSKMDSSLQNVVKDVLLNTDWVDSLPSDVKSNSWDEVSNWLQRYFLYAINDIDNEEIEKALADVFNEAFTTESLQEIINQLTSSEYGFTENNPLILYLQTKLTERTELVNDVKNKLQDEFDSRVEELSIKDLNIAANLEVKEGTLLSWDTLIAKIEEAKAKLPDLSKWFDLNKDSLNAFQSQMKTLGDALSSIKSGNFEDSDLGDLLKEFPELANRTGNLESAITELIDNALKELYETLGEDIPDGWNIYIQEMADIASGTAKHLSDAFSDIHDSCDILYDFKEAMNSGFDENVTDSLLQSVRKLSGEMETLVAGYYSGVVTAEQLYEALTEHYENDLHNYSEALIKKNFMNEEFYNAVGLASEEVTNQFMDCYEVDIKNCTTYNKAKIAIEEQTLDKISSMWSKYYDVQSKTYTSEAKVLEIKFANGDVEAGKLLDQIKGQVTEYENRYKAAMEALNNITYEGIRSNFESISGKFSASSSGSGSSSAFAEMIDYFERRVNVLSKALSLLETNLDNVTGAFAKNNLIDAELGLTEEKFKNYSDALNMYTQKANEALSKLPSDIAQKIRDGAVSLTDFIGDGNKDVVDAIKDYEQWADKIADCQQELAELKTAIRQLELQKFNSIMEDFTAQFDLRENGKDLISKQIDLLKEAGELIGESFFTAQIEQSKKQLTLLEEEKAQLVNQMSSALSSGRIQAGTDEWLEMVEALSDVEGNILDCRKAIESLDNELLQLHTEIFDRIQDQFSNLDSEISNIIGLFEDFDVANDKGIWSSSGLAQLGLLVQQYELAQYQIQQYNNEIDELNRLYLEGRYSATEYADRLAELSKKQWDAVNASESAKDAIMDLNEARIDLQIKGIEKEIDAYKELTDEAIKNLKAEKDLYDWKNKLKDLNKSITDIERQLASMEGDNTAATVAKRKKLEQELADAKADLDDEMYQHSIEVQEDALNRQYEDYESTRKAEIDALQESLKDQETMIAESFESVKNNADLIGQEIANMAVQHGITVSDALISSWQSGENAIASYGEVLSQNTSAFIGNIMAVEQETWNLQEQANNTANSLAWMFSTRADNLVNELAQSYYAEGNLNAMTQALHDSLVNTLERGYNISNIVNALNSISNGVNGVANAANNAAQALEKLGALSSVSTGTSNGGSGGFSNKSFAQEKFTRYASGARHLPNDEIAITQEDGTEIILSPARGGLLLPNEAYLNKEGTVTDLRKGDTVLTAEQTDNMFEWAQFSPEDFKKELNITPNIPNIAAKPVNNTIQIDNILTVQGNIDNGNVKRMEQVAQRAINDAFKQFSYELKY